MSKTIRCLVAFLLAVCCASVLFACGGNTNTNTSTDNANSQGNTGDNSAAESKEEVVIDDYDHTIVFYSTQGDALQAKTQIAIDAFEAKYPGWKVVHTQVGGYDDVKAKIVSDLQGGLQPDLAYCYPDHVAQYLQTSKVVDMSKYINSTETVKDAGGNDVLVGYTKEELADFVEGYYNEGKAYNYGEYKTYGYSDDSMMTLPFVKSTELLYYNADALKECGFVDENGNAKPAETWDELWSQCATIRAKYPSATPLGYDSEANWFITMCEQNGWGYTTADSSNHYLFNNDSTRAWLEQLADYYDEGYIVTQNEYGSYTSNLFTKGMDDGGIAYCIGSSGGASYQASNKFTWGVAAVPGSKQADGSVNKAVISQGPSLVMLYSDKAKDQDEKAKMTFLFVKELLDPTFQAEFGIASGYNPCRKSTVNVEAYQEHLDGDSITAVAASVATTMVNDFFTSPAFVGSSTARTQVGNVIVYVITGQKSAAKALADAYSNCGGK